jgi:hypothetical protein
MPGLDPGIFFLRPPKRIAGSSPAMMRKRKIRKIILDFYS